jgi:hypothetical protein
VGLVQLAHNRLGRCVASCGPTETLGSVPTCFHVVGIAHDPTGEEHAEAAPERKRTKQFRHRTPLFYRNVAETRAVCRTDHPTPPALPPHAPATPRTIQRTARPVSGHQTRFYGDFGLPMQYTRRCRCPRSACTPVPWMARSHMPPCAGIATSLVSVVHLHRWESSRTEFERDSEVPIRDTGMSHRSRASDQVAKRLRGGRA